MSNLIDKILKYANRNKARSNPSPLPYPGCGYQATVPPMPKCEPPRTGSCVQRPKSADADKPNVAIVIKHNVLYTEKDIRDKFANSMTSGAIGIDKDIKIVFVDLDTGKIISEI